MIWDNEFKMRVHWDDTAECYISRRAFSPADNRILELIAEISPKRLLEIGLGPALIASNIQKHYPHIQYFGLDITQAFLDYAKKLLPHPALIKATALNLPFKHNSLDCILEMDTIHHVPKELLSKVIDEIYRAVQPGGLFILLEDWGKKAENEREQIIKEFIEHRHTYRTGMEYHPTDSEWRELLVNAGFSISHSEHISRQLDLDYYEKLEAENSQALLQKLKTVWVKEQPSTQMTLLLGKK